MSHVLESLAASATQGGGSIALSDERRTYTYAALHTEIGVVARLLRERIPGRGPVAIVADNSCADGVAELVGIEGGVVSGVINLESSGVEASDWRPRHDEQYHEV
jgi:acyl-CoA synthetase (AMP-forming)/AMP-acid ligase II